MGLCRFDINAKIATVSINLKPKLTNLGAASIVLPYSVEELFKHASVPKTARPKEFMLQVSNVSETAIYYLNLRINYLYILFIQI